MIRVSCTIQNCFLTGNYKQTMAYMVKNPPFENIPLLEGEHKHIWKFEEIKIGR